MTPERMYDIPQLDARDTTKKSITRSRVRTAIPGWPFRMSPGPTAIIDSRRRRLGSTTRRSCAGLGLTDDDLEELRARHVIGEAALNA